MRLDVIDIIKAISILMIVNVHLLSGELFTIGSTYHVIALLFITGITQYLHNMQQNLASVAIGKVSMMIDLKVI